MVITRTYRSAVGIIVLWYLVLRVDCIPGVTSVLFEDYDSSQRPNKAGPPIVVEASVYVSSFGNVEETSMEYKIFGYFRQYWKDARLANRLNESVILKGLEIENMWRPDPFCYNARESSLTVKDSDINSMVTIKPTGDIVYSRMTIITAECEMDLHDFPMDHQKCKLTFGSYSYSTENIRFVWRQPPSNAVAVRNRNLAQFSLKTFKSREFNEIYELGNFSIIEVDFLFERRLGYYLIQVYAPDIFVVVLSWIVFWMDRDDMGNRMALGITNILTIMFLLASVNTSMPRVSYPKALDWYLMVSFALVFFALIECMAVFVLDRRQVKKKEKGLKKMTDSEHNTTRVPCVGLRMRDKAHVQIEMRPATQVNLPSVKTQSSIAKVEKNTKDNHLPNESPVDKVSRILFPLAFVCFNAVYWVMYLTRAPDE